MSNILISIEPKSTQKENKTSDRIQKPISKILLNKILEFKTPNQLELQLAELKNRYTTQRLIKLKESNTRNLFLNASMDERRLIGHSHVNAIIYSKQEECLIAFYANGLIRKYCLKYLIVQYESNFHKSVGEIFCVRKLNEDYFATGGDMIAIWDSLKVEVLKYVNISYEVFSLEFFELGLKTNGEKYISAGLDDGSVILWAFEYENYHKYCEFKEDKYNLRLVNDEVRVRSLLYFDFASAYYLVCGNLLGDITIWDLSIKKVLRTAKEHSQVVYELIRLGYYSSRYVSVSADFLVKIWDINQKSSIYTISDHGKWVCSAIYNVNSDLLIIGSYDGKIRIYDPNTYEVIKEKPTKFNNWKMVDLSDSPNKFLLITIMNRHNYIQVYKK